MAAEDPGRAGPAGVVRVRARVAVERSPVADVSVVSPVSRSWSRSSRATGADACAALVGAAAEPLRGRGSGRGRRSGGTASRPATGPPAVTAVCPLSQAALSRPIALKPCVPPFSRGG